MTGLPLDVVIIGCTAAIVVLLIFIVFCQIILAGDSGKSDRSNLIENRRAAASLDLSLNELRDIRKDVARIVEALDERLLIDIESIRESNEEIKNRVQEVSMEYIDNLHDPRTFSAGSPGGGRARQG